MNWVTILEFLAEGGSLSLLGNMDEIGTWRFRLSTDETTLMDEDDNPAEFKSESMVVEGWNNAISLLNKKYPYWTRLHLHKIHPDFAIKFKEISNNLGNIGVTSMNCSEINEEYRRSDFKLGCLHGRRDAENVESEAHIQRIVYQSMRIKLVCSNDNKIDIRVIGYEIPLTRNTSRGKCIDLLGYDINHNLYLIELKKGSTSEQIPKIVEQISDYKNILQTIIPCIEDEFYKTFYLTITTKNIVPILLAPKEFYQSRIKDIPKNSEIQFCYFRTQDILSHDPSKPVSIHIVKGNK